MFPKNNQLQCCFIELTRMKRLEIADKCFDEINRNIINKLKINLLEI